MARRIPAAPSPDYVWGAESTAATLAGPDREQAFHTARRVLSDAIEFPHHAIRVGKDTVSALLDCLPRAGPKSAEDILESLVWLGSLAGPGLERAVGRYAFGRPISARVAERLSRAMAATAHQLPNQDRVMVTMLWLALPRPDGEPDATAFAVPCRVHDTPAASR